MTEKSIRRAVNLASKTLKNKPRRHFDDGGEAYNGDGNFSDSDLQGLYSSAMDSASMLRDMAQQTESPDFYSDRGRDQSFTDSALNVVNELFGVSSAEAAPPWNIGAPVESDQFFTQAEKEKALADHYAAKEARANAYNIAKAQADLAEEQSIADQPMIDAMYGAPPSTTTFGSGIVPAGSFTPTVDQLISSNTSRTSPFDAFKQATTFDRPFSDSSASNPFGAFTQATISDRQFPDTSRPSPFEAFNQATISDRPFPTSNLAKDPETADKIINEARATAVANSPASVTPTTSAPVSTTEAASAPAPDLPASRTMAVTSDTLPETTNDVYKQLMNAAGFNSEDPAQIAAFNREASKALGYTTGPQSSYGVLSTGQRTPQTDTFMGKLGGILEDALSPRFIGVNDPNYAKMAGQQDNLINYDRQNGRDSGNINQYLPVVAPVATAPVAPVATTAPNYTPYIYKQNMPYTNYGAFGAYPYTYNTGINFAAVPGYRAEGGEVLGNNALANSLRMAKMGNK